MEGMRSQAWSDMIQSPWFYPLQQAFADAQDVFNVMFLWAGIFAVVVFRQDGSIECVNTEIPRSVEARDEARRSGPGGGNEPRESALSTEEPQSC